MDNEFIASLTETCPSCTDVLHSPCTYSYTCHNGEILTPKGRSLLEFMAEWTKVRVHGAPGEGEIEVNG